MPERMHRWLGLPGIALVVAAAWAGAWSPLFVLAGAWLLALACVGEGMRMSMPVLAMAWLAAFGISGVLLAWPLGALVDGGGLGAATAASAAAGLVLLGCWRTWPLWQRLRSGQVAGMGDWRRVIELEPVAWQGLKVAVPVAAILVGGIALGWPEAAPLSWRIALAVALAVLAAWPWLMRKPALAGAQPSQGKAAMRKARVVQGSPTAVEAELPASTAPASEVPAKAPSSPTRRRLFDWRKRKDTPAAPPPLRNADRIDFDTLWQPAPPSASAPADANAMPAEAPPVAETAPEPASPILTVYSDEQIAAASASLYAAARAGRVEPALALLDEGADPLAAPPAGDRDQRGLAQLAAVLPDLRLLRALIQRGVALNAEPGKPTPLLAATRDSWHGRPDAVMTLLANGADPRARDGEGNTPLHHAARSTDPGVAALLLDAAAQIDALNDARQSPLAMACLAGNWRLARFLIERGAQVHPAAGDPVLLAAAASEEDDPVGVEYLLRHKAAVDARGHGGRTGLQQAAMAGRVAIVQTLVDAGADIRQRDDEGLDAWMLAASGGHLPVLEALRDAGAPVDAVDGDGRDALLRAVVGGQASAALARWLRERGLDVDRRDDNGLRAIDRAVAEGRWSLVAAIDPRYPVPAAARTGETEADHARPPMQLLSEALAEGDGAGLARIAPLLSAQERGRALVEAAATDPSRIALLLPHRPSLEERDARGDGAVFLLLDQAGDADARQALVRLLDAGALPAGRGGLARFLGAAAAARLPASEGSPLAMRLLDAGADPFAGDREGESPLLLALRAGWPEVALRLLAQGADPNRTDARGLAPLHVATALGLEAVVPALLRHGAQPHLHAGDGQTALGVALASGHRGLVDWLDWRVWPHPGRALRASDLPATAILGDVDGVQRLLDLGFDVDARDAQGCTALLRASGGGHDAVVARLLEAGAKTGLAAASGAIPLSAAVSMRHLPVVDRLLRAGVDLDQRLPGEVSVLMLATALGLPDVASRLLGAGADLQAGDAEGLRPIHCAALFGFSTRDRSRLLALLDTLHLAGARPDEATSAGLTPLLLLLGARAEPGAACDEGVLIAGVERLLEEGVSLEAQDQRGFGPLHLAALHGLGAVVGVLLKAGADPQLRDRLNRTPREIATMRGFMDVAAEFSHDAPPSMARFLRTPDR